MNCKLGSSLDQLCSSHWGQLFQRNHNAECKIKIGFPNTCTIYALMLSSEKPGRQMKETVNWPSWIELGKKVLSCTNSDRIEYMQIDHKSLSILYIHVQYRLNPYVHQPRVSRGGRKGSVRVLPLRPPREERTKHETKPRRNLGKHAFFKGRVFVLLITFVYSLFVFHC